MVAREVILGLPNDWPAELTRIPNKPGTTPPGLAKLGRLKAELQIVTKACPKSRMLLYTVYQDLWIQESNSIRH